MKEKFLKNIVTELLVVAAVSTPAPDIQGKPLIDLRINKVPYSTRTNLGQCDRMHLLIDIHEPGDGHSIQQIVVDTNDGLPHRPTQYFHPPFGRSLGYTHQPQQPQELEITATAYVDTNQPGGLRRVEDQESVTLDCK